ncbi:cytochrome-c oxidase, cbb3-type subunit III [Anianabacter salinae]|uniref:cytochrome-c oxidase, cbb3-type subunit III n=1 Tax=Anianabacter salinae TaxID=2851023 RepID=UPI00225DDA0D|nr:cytochrome-c oxidase, cbb3-type subunit III [Anianabacter salinae]MBV0910859.1 cytochrome-c oxidase, cbb3-type subunit III [Anianabacter salinae]
MARQPEKKQDPETTGHEWDGIEELNNPLPRWWLWTFYATIIWGVGYTIAYPAWPMVSGATAGVLGFSTRAQVAEQISEVEARNAALETQLASADLTTISANGGELYNYAVQGGAAIFRTNCSQCHGSGAAGAKGYPNLLDDAWLWGGTIEDIQYTVTHGIRNEQSPDTRWSEMPAFGADGILSDEEIGEVVQYVLQISGQGHDAALAGAGETLFLDNCAACHGDEGLGDVYVGAPNLTDAIWLYGGDPVTLTETVTNARFGVMPAWSEEYRTAAGLTEAEINAVATYVHQLGGGE